MFRSSYNFNVNIKNWGIHCVRKIKQIHYSFRGKQRPASVLIEKYGHLTVHTIRVESGRLQNGRKRELSVEIRSRDANKKMCNNGHMV